MGWQWRTSICLTWLFIQAALIQCQENDGILPNDLFLIEDEIPDSTGSHIHIHKRGAGCIFEPEIIPEGSEQFGLRLKPLKNKSPSFLEPAASTYRATQYQPARYNLPPLVSSETNNVNNVDYPPYNPPAKTTKNPFSVSNYKATTPKFDDNVEPAGSGDVFDAVKPTTSAPEYLPPDQESQTPAPRPRPVVPRQRLVQQPTQNVNYINPAPRQPLSQNYLPSEPAASNVDTVRQPFQPPRQLLSPNYLPAEPAASNVETFRQTFKNSAYYTPVQTNKPVPQPSNNYYVQTPSTTMKPIRVENLKAYLPPDESGSPDATNDNPAVLKPAQSTPDEHYHTLEELCNDPFHSFLCEPLKPRSKDRFKNRNSKKVESGTFPDSTFLQPRVVAPSTTTPKPDDQSLVPASSFQDITKTKLEDKHDCDKQKPVIPSASNNQLSVRPVPQQSYLPPVPSPSTPVPSTTAPGTGLYAKNPFSELVFQPIRQASSPQPFVASTYLQPQTTFAQAKPLVPQASNNQFQFFPPLFPSTTKPLKIPDHFCNKNKQTAEIPAASSVSASVQGYNYPQPSVPSPSTTGYSYPQPAASAVVSTGYSYPQPSASTIVTTGYSYPKPSPSAIVSTISYPQPAASNIVTTGYSYPKPSPSAVEPTGYSYPQPAASNVVTTGYSYPKPSTPAVAPTGYSYPQPASSNVVTTGYNYPQPAASSVESVGYNNSQPTPAATTAGYSYPEPNPAFNEVPQSSNEQPAITNYQYPVPAFNQQFPQPAASINYLAPQPTAFTASTTSVPSTVSTTPESKEEEFPPVNPNQFTFQPGEIDEIYKFQGYDSNKPKPSAVPEKIIGTGSSAKNEKPLVPAADTSNAYYYPSPQPVPAASTNVQSFEGYSYPSPSNNQPVFETTPKADDGYNYPVPPADKRLGLPSNFFEKRVKLPVEDKKSLVKYEKDDCDRRPHFSSETGSSQGSSSQFQSNLAPAGDSNIFVVKV